MTHDEVKEAVKDIIATIAPDEDLGGSNDTELLRTRSSWTPWTSSTS